MISYNPAKLTLIQAQALFDMTDKAMIFCHETNRIILVDDE